MKKLIHAIRSFYGARNRREKAMLWLFLAAIVLIWFSQLAKIQRKNSDDLFELNAKKTLAESVIAQGGLISKELADMQEKLDASKAVSLTGLQKTLEDGARAANLSYEITASRTDVTDKATIYSIRLNSQKSDIAALIDFELRLREFYPYISVSDVSFNSDGKGKINARYSICSFEFSAKNPNN